MVKPEWGTKRECIDCGARFYDMSKDPIICPKCEAVVTPETAKPSRAEARAKVKQEAAEKAKAEEAKASALSAKSSEAGDDEADLLEAAGIDDDSDDDDEDDTGLIEGGFDRDDDNDVSGVVDAPMTSKTEDT